MADSEFIKLKQCSKCQGTFPVESFPVRNKRSGLRRTWCRNCERHRLQEYAAAHPDKIAEYNKKKVARGVHRGRYACFTEAEKRYHRARSNRWYHTNRPRAIARRQQWTETHRARTRDTQRRSQALHKEARNAGRRTEARRIANRADRVANPEKYRKWAKRFHTRHPQYSRIRLLKAIHIEPIDRAKLIERDEATCYLCRRFLLDAEITLDHVIPLKRGGPHTEDNLRVACKSCNSKKQAKTLEEYLALSSD